MARIDPITSHPVKGLPYDHLNFVKMNSRRVPLYSVHGYTGAPTGAKEALGRAFARYGGRCFYCRKKFGPQPLSRKLAHRDHIIAESHGGSDRLHNLVIACTPCGTAKGDRSIQDFRPQVAKEYLAALERHIARALGCDASPLSPLPPKPAAAAGP